MIEKLEIEQRDNISGMSYTQTANHQEIVDKINQLVDFFNATNPERRNGDVKDS